MLTFFIDLRIFKSSLIIEFQTPSSKSGDVKMKLKLASHFQPWILKSSDSKPKWNINQKQVLKSAKSKIRVRKGKIWSRENALMKLFLLPKRSETVFFKVFNFFFQVSKLCYIIEGWLSLKNYLQNVILFHFGYRKGWGVGVLKTIFFEVSDITFRK